MALGGCLNEIGDVLPKEVFELCCRLMILGHTTGLRQGTLVSERMGDVVLRACCAHRRRDWD
jgi:hypothetical protein